MSITVDYFDVQVYLKFPDFVVSLFMFLGKVYFIPFEIFIGFSREFLVSSFVVVQ